MDTITITRPDDWHIHLRDNAMLEETVPGTSRHFARALVMPNLTPPLTTAESILAYRKRIQRHIPKEHSFKPYFTLYLTDQTTTETIKTIAKHPDILGCKMYPAHATTNSSAGVQCFKAMYPIFECMQEHGLVLQIHGETTTDDIFSRESAFIDSTLIDIIKRYPKLRIVLEHISTEHAVDFISQSSEYVAATITPHHLLFNRNDLLEGGIRPHLYCLPILKTINDQYSLQQAATSGNPKFFAGTDSAPHLQGAKESACGCAGIYSAPFALTIYTSLFDSLGEINKLENFMSTFGANFYNLPINEQKITLKRTEYLIPKALSAPDGNIIPIAADTAFPWSIDEP